MPDSNRIFRMIHADISTGYPRPAEIDLIFEDGLRPVAVLKWGGPPDKQFPEVTVPLDPKLLLPYGREDIQYIYQGQIEAPHQAS